MLSHFHVLVLGSWLLALGSYFINLFMKREDIEILAPVGSWESLAVAVKSGANAVYFGIDRLNMRSKSTLNFSLNDLSGIVDFCNSHKVKTYMTLNAVIYNEDLLLMRKLVDAAKDNHIDAIIGSDISVIEYANSIGVEVHISTQQNISNIEAVKFFSKFADVIVLARELTLEQINVIYKAIYQDDVRGPSGNYIKLELFIHGAMCMAISGKCYLSLHSYNKSANCGNCLQICRRSYIVTDKETNNEFEIDNHFIMSPKDLCTIEFLDQILNSGVSVLKIEGRARQADYVKTVVEAYSEAVNAIYNGIYSPDNIAKWKDRLSTVFNRGFWDGYYLGKTIDEWSDSYGSKATKKKIYIGKGMNYFTDLNIAEFLVETGSVSVGDEILITGPTTGLIETQIKEIRVNLLPVNEAVKGDRFSMQIDEHIRRSDKLYKIVPNKQ